MSCFDAQQVDIPDIYQELYGNMIKKLLYVYVIILLSMKQKNVTRRFMVWSNVNMLNMAGKFKWTDLVCI